MKLYEGTAAEICLELERDYGKRKPVSVVVLRRRRAGRDLGRKMSFGNHAPLTLEGRISV